MRVISMLIVSPSRVLDQRLLAGACADVRVTDIEMTAPIAAAATAIVIIESRKLSRAISPLALP